MYIFLILLIIYYGLVTRVVFWAVFYGYLVLWSLWCLAVECAIGLWLICSELYRCHYFVQIDDVIHSS